MMNGLVVRRGKEFLARKSAKRSTMKTASDTESLKRGQTTAVTTTGSSRKFQWR